MNEQLTFQGKCVINQLKNEAWVPLTEGLIFFVDLLMVFKECVY
jgi:hypothetical protein